LLASCASIVDKGQRLACFDELAAKALSPAPENSGSSVPESSRPAARPVSVLADRSSSTYSLSDRWELESASKRGVFSFRPYRDNYVLFYKYSTHPNAEPYRSLAPVAPGARLSNQEVAFQLSFKLKLIENAFASPVDVWAAYTQQSFWQAYNSGASSPFRESNYQPEIMAVVPVDLSTLGVTSAFGGLGLVHQSNGQTPALSRSWNRFYVQLGAAKGDFSVIARAWARIGDIDDNPDISTYMGYGDVTGTYRWRGHEFSALVRQNFATRRGAVQASWAFPVIANLKGYVQVFSGYGQSLIDYNASQTTIGLGALVGF
jgi:phospholipase A1